MRSPTVLGMIGQMDAPEPFVPPPLLLDVRERDALLLVTPSGEVDAHTCSKLGDVLRRAAAEREDHLVLDLSKVSFMDSSGLSVLLNAQRRLTRDGRRFVLAVPDGQVRNLLRQTDLDSTFAVHGSRRDAERAARA